MVKVGDYFIVTEKSVEVINDMFKTNLDILKKGEEFIITGVTEMFGAWGITECKHVNTDRVVSIKDAYQYEERDLWCIFLEEDELRIIKE